jgi:excisionase family DNA binding protein
VTTPPKITLDDLIAHPDRADALPDDQVRDTLKLITERTSALKALESQITWRLLAERNTNIDSDGFPRLLNAGQLAEHLGVPETWVREQARLGQLPSIKLGHYVRFRLDDVKRYLSAPKDLDFADHPIKSKRRLTRHETRDDHDFQSEGIAVARSTSEAQWPLSKDFTSRSALGELADVLTAWTTVLLAHAVHENGFFSRLRRRLKSTSQKPS